MTYQTINKFAEPTELYSALFDAMPGNSILVQTDSPRFTILAVTEGMVKHAGLTKELLLNKPFFEPFPANPGNKDDPNATGQNGTLASFEHVIKNKEPHQLPLLRCDLENEDGVFNELYWCVINKPVLGNKGEVIYIIYSLEDVTEHVLPRKRADESETHLELLRNIVPAMIFYLDGEQRYRSYNETFMNWFGVNAKEVIGKTVQEFLGEEAYRITLPHLAIAYSGKQEQYEMFAPSKMNAGRWLSIIYTPHKIEEGKVIGVIVHATDITYIKQAEFALQQSEQNLRNTILQAPIAMCIFRGADYVVEIANERMFKFWGRGGEEVLNKPIFEGMPELKNQGYEDLLHNVFTNGERFSAQGIPVKVPRNDKVETAYIDLLYEALREGNGTISGVIAVAIDVTEQVVARLKIEESEQALRSFILQAPIAIAILRSRNYVVEIVNEHALEFWGRSSSEVMNKALFDCLPELRNQGFKEFFDNIFDTGVPVTLTEHPIEFVRGGKLDKFYFNFLYEVLHDANGKVNGLITVGVDVTLQTMARQKIEDVVAERTKELADANKELQRSNQNLEEFAHAASHDLKEPIRKIHIFTKQLKSQLAPQLKETELRSFNRIENATERMGKLIDDLLLYSHVSQRPHEMEIIDLGQKVQRVLEDLELDVEEKKATIHIGDLPMVRGYRRQLQQLFQNLFTNALKYSKANAAPIIEISSKQVTEDGQAYHLITVKDNGIGFEQKYADKIFQMFSRLHGKSEYSGTGVGLSIVKKVVENHRGFIKAESSPGEGSTFYVFLPVD